MTRNTHRFPLLGEILESHYIIASPDEWDSSPESGDSRWSVFRGPATVFANRLALPGSILLPLHGATAGGPPGRLNDGRVE